MLFLIFLYNEVLQVFFKYLFIINYYNYFLNNYFTLKRGEIWEFQDVGLCLSSEYTILI